ncbi:AAA-ATPase At5g17750-like [Punica granatum]|uniref:AAA-ATPase At5g17750-like n=1 Tax=Punica granatum TaxID=22663 RepID=A0A6P8DYB3_PUNGR|nr:AAA-ATPase At5g17750-like [Punica granatum]
MMPPNVKEIMASPSSLFSVYASFTASMMLARTMVNDIVPRPVQSYLWRTIRHLFKAKLPVQERLTFVVEEYAGDLGRNEIFVAAELYLSSKIGTNTDRLKISKSSTKNHVLVRLAKDETILDTFEGVELKWKFVTVTTQHAGGPSDGSEEPPESKRCFELSFDKKHKDKIIESYVPFVIQKASDLKDKEKVLKMFTLGGNRGRPMNGPNGAWSSINLEHPSTFDTLAMEPEQKKAIMNDLDRFLSRREFYKRVGRAWKRGYLLYGPPGTGKSSLVAAMANYLKFNVYDLQLSNIMSDSQLRQLLLCTGNSSILVIEDIDCSIDLPERAESSDGPLKSLRCLLTLSGLLNFIDGLWSSCGDERIIVFTTNHVDKLDPALLRPGRMDMHIHMSYCTFHGFKLLASNYLEITDIDSKDHQHRHVFTEIEGLIEETKVTPAEVAEEFMKSEDPSLGLSGLVNLLKRKKMEDPVDGKLEVVDDEDAGQLRKKQKVDGGN